MVVWSAFELKPLLWRALFYQALLSVILNIPTCTYVVQVWQTSISRYKQYLCKIP
jgi:hypothetical protein